jgi:signal peptidase I
MYTRASRHLSYREQNTFGRVLRRIGIFLLLLFLVYSFVTAVLVKSVVQRSEAMQPTLAAGDRFLIVPLLYGPRIRVFGWTMHGFAEPRRGDLVAVRPGYMDSSSALRRLADPFVRFFTFERRRAADGSDWRSSVQIKRLIGLPGDTIRIERFVAYVKPQDASRFQTEFQLAGFDYELITDNRPIDWQALDPFGEAMDEFRLADNEYFVLSDNRSEGIDSRHWGPVTFEDLHGRIVLRYWPFSRWESL